MAIDPNAIIPGKYDLNLRGRKVIGVGGDENDSQFDAANIQQVSGSNVWQESLRNEYTNGQQVRDFRAILQGNVTTDTITHIGGANDYDFDFDVFEKPTDETDQVYFQRFGINPVSGVDIIEVTNVQRNTPGQGQTRITLQPPVNVDFTLTYPPANLGEAIGATTRNYTRRELEYDGVTDVPRPIDDTYGLVPDPNFRVYVSLYWVASVFNGDNWRPHQDYLEGDTVSYIDNVGVPRHVFCREAHTSSDATSPILSSAVSHTADGFGPTRPWEPIGSSIDLSTGTFEAPVQLLGSDGNAAIVLSATNDATPGVDQWTIVLGQGTTGIPLPADQMPSVGDLISFGTGNAGTTEEYRAVAVNNNVIANIRFAGSVPAEVRALVDDLVDNPVNIFNAGLRTDFGQVDRFVFDPEDFAINTEAQDIGHAHISLSSAHPSLPSLHYGGVWTNGGTTANPTYISETIDIVGIFGEEHADHTFNNIAAWQADTDTVFRVGEYVTVDSSSTAIYRITVESVGYDANGFEEFAIGDEETENLIIATSSDVERADGRFPTTEAWQNNRFELKGQGGSHISVATTGVTDTTTNVTYNASNKQNSLPSLGLGSMVVDVRTSTSDPINFQGFKPLMTGLDSGGNQQDQNFAVEEASEDRQQHVTSKEWQEAYFGALSDVQALQAQVHQIEEELGNAQEYNYATETPYVDAFLTERTDEIGTKLNTITVFYPNFDPVSNVFTTYARLTDAQFSAFDDVANDGNVIIGFGPDSTSLIPFQLLSYGPNGRGTIAAGEATYEFKLKLIDADEPYTGTGAITDATHKSQFESWNTAEQGGIFYYAEESANIDTIGHATGQHITGSALTPDERVVIDNLTANEPRFVGNLDITGNLDVTGTTNGADSNAVAYVAIQLSAGIPTPITPTGAVAGHIYLQYTARYNGSPTTLVDDIDTTAVPVATTTTYVNFVSVASPGTEIPQE